MTENGQALKSQAVLTSRVLEIYWFGPKRISYLSEGMPQTDAVRFEILNFGNCDLFDICYLEFVVLRVEAI